MSKCLYVMNEGNHFYPGCTKGWNDNALVKYYIMIIFIQLGVFVRIQQDAQVFQSDVMHTTMQAVVEELLQENPSNRVKHTLRNLLRLAQWESKQDYRTQARNSVQGALHKFLNRLTPCLYYNDVEVSGVALELLTVIGLPAKQGIDDITKLCFAAASFFFNCLHSEGALFIVYFHNTMIEDLTAQKLYIAKDIVH